MRLSDIKAGSFWLEDYSPLRCSIFVLRPLEPGRFSVLVSRSDGLNFVTDWWDYERSPVTKELR